jgi:hypothetical protein
MSNSTITWEEILKANKTDLNTGRTLPVIARA